MSLFDKDLIESEEHYRQIISIEEDIALSLGPGAHVIDSKDTDAFLENLFEKLIKNTPVLGSGPLADKLKSQQGRSIIRWDVKSFRKNNAIGSMYSLSRLKDKPIVIIENITEIPDGDRSIYDDPDLVENVLLHSWKNDVIHLTHPQYGPFQLNREDYTVIFPVNPGWQEKLHHSAAGEMAVIQF